MGWEVSPVWRDERELVRVGNEDWVDVTFKASESVCAKVLRKSVEWSSRGKGVAYVDWADEVLGARQ